MPSLKLEAITTSLLDPVDLVINEGETVVLHGPSGSGKTLLLRAIAEGAPLLETVAESARRRWKRPLDERRLREAAGARDARRRWLRPAGARWRLDLDAVLARAQEWSERMLAEAA